MKCKWVPFVFFVCFGLFACVEIERVDEESKEEKEPVRLVEETPTPEEITPEEVEPEPTPPELVEEEPSPTPEEPIPDLPPTAPPEPAEVPDWKEAGGLPAMRGEHLRKATEWLDEAFADRRLLAPRSFDLHWGEEQWAGGFHTIFDAIPSDVETRFNVRREDDKLLIKVRCENPPVSEGPSGGRIWVMLSPGSADERFVQIEATSAGRIQAVSASETPGRAGGVIRRILNYGQRLTPSIDGRVETDSDGWTVTLEVPFEIFGIRGPEAGDRWRINVIRDRAGIAPITSWFPLRQSYREWGLNGNLFHMENRYGELVFAGAETPTRMEGVALQYVDPETKRILFEEDPPRDMEHWSWTWSSPGAVAEPVETRAGGDGQSLVITHPFPGRPGRYVLEGRAPDGSVQVVFHADNEAMIRAGAARVRARSEGPRRSARRVSLQPISGEAAELMEMMPDSNGFRRVASPAAPDANQDRGTGNFKWDPSEPNQMECVRSGKIFPNPDEYPTSGETLFGNQRGEKVAFPYVERRDGVKCYLEPRLWAFQIDHILDRLPEVARRDPSGAARVLYELSLRYPGFVQTFDHHWSPSSVEEDIGPPYRQARSGVWASWPEHREVGQTLKLAEAYDLLRETDVMEQLSREKGVEVADQIEFGLIRPSVQHFRSFSIHNHNIDGYGYQDWVELAKVLGEPDYLHEALERTESMAADEFFVDGFFNEITLSYHQQTLRNSFNRLADSIGDWKDPAGIVSPRLGRRIENFDLREDLLERYPNLDRAYELSREIRYPNGRSLPVQDTWAVDSGAARTEARPAFFPGSRLARLEREDRNGIAQAWLLAHPKHTGHTHRDALNLALFAYDIELIPLLGYDRSHIRSWSQSTLAQNTVVVDSTNFSDSDMQEGGRLRLFAPFSDQVQVVRVSQNNVLPGVVTRYERELWMIERAGGGFYLVDIFRVEGGERHEYTLNGEALHESTFQSAQALEPYNDYLLPPGTSVRDPRRMGDPGDAGGHYPSYLFIREVESAKLPNGKFNVEMEGRKVALRGRTFETTNNSLPGFRLTGFSGGDADDQLFLGRAPSLRPARWTRDSRENLWSGSGNRDQVWQHWMPKMVVRREGRDLSSTFVSVIEPHPADRAPGEMTVERSQLGGLTVVSIKYGEVEDLILSADNPAEAGRGPDGVSLDGLCGFIRLRRGRVEEMHLAGAELVAPDGTRLEGPGRWEGEIVEVRRQSEGAEGDGFVVEGDLAGDLAGATFLVRHPDDDALGFTVLETRPHGNGQTLVLVDSDPGMELREAGAALVFFPFTEWSDEPQRFEIIGRASRP